MRLTPTAAGTVAGIAMLAVYSATMAPGLTFWDSGELIAAVESLGIPHPPGMPLYVLAARAFSDLVPVLPRAAAMNLFSAVCTGLTVAIIAVLLARWMESGWMALAGAMVAGAGSTVWRSATEAEVYAPVMLVSLLVLWAADNAARERGTRRARWLVLAAYLLAMAVPLHLGILVVAPAAAVRVALGAEPGVRWNDAALVTAVAVLAVAVGRGSVVVLAAGVALIAATGAMSGRGGARLALACGAAALLAASAVAFVPVRAAFDPAVNTGYAIGWDALLGLLGRAQYDVPGLWPRQAPLWAQLANWFEYADWQFALGLGPGVAPTVGRTAFTLLFAALGLSGARAHWRRDRRSALVLGTLFACATVGLVLYMNFKAGASFGYGILPDDMPHEARDRDYFFVLGFVVWGAWAGAGTVAWAAARGWPPALAAAAIVSIPVALNWSAVTRTRQPVASLPRIVGEALLWSAPRNAVVITGGDNDSFPLWYAQAVHGTRLDVRIVVAPLLGAEWYRAELARRDSLLPVRMAGRWYGERETLAAIDSAARLHGRPFALALTASEHRWLIPA
ncbi:MAG TPA: DUF2723 domain-containing protein, partial [Gemmatimonadaceae bacterium]|nr:DUF2723 domain-containing protein [Gemmatimonadaceae bacterium]